MFCYQCEETATGSGCTKAGVCGKNARTADMQDKLIYLLKGISALSPDASPSSDEVHRYVTEALFATVTNTNFDPAAIEAYIDRGFALKESLGTGPSWAQDLTKEWLMSHEVGVLDTENVDVRSLRELLTYGVKGLAAYVHHAAALGYEDPSLYAFMEEALCATTEDRSAEDLTALVLRCGEMGVRGMALLDKANTETYGHPEPTQVSIAPRDRPGILISGHDLHDLSQLLEQTRGTGVDVYTHGEMLPANSYPAFKAYDHFVGNYGGAWWKQKEEFESFNGPIVLTTNCLVPPRDSYRPRLYTTGPVGYEGVQRVPEQNGRKDFSAIIAQAAKAAPPTPLESGTIWGGFAHDAVLSVAGAVVDAVKSGAIRRFVVMAGCDGRHKEREYYTDFAKALPNDTIILTAGCAKYRYNKLDLGDIGGIPRVLDAGQCNDSYSLVVIAQALAEAFGLDDINKLPVTYNIAWYEQKAVLVLLALLHLGVKNITLGPVLPAFVSPGVLDVLVNTFGIRKNTTLEEDLPLLG